MSATWGIYGPETHRAKWRIRLRSPDGKWRSRTFETESEAAEYRQAIEHELDKEDAFRRAARMYAEAERALTEARALQGSRRTLSEAIDAYEHYLRHDKQNKPRSVETTIYRFKGILGPLYETEIAVITKSKANASYRARVDTGVSAATHQNELRQTRTLWRWLIKRGWAVINPWIDVEPIGRVNRGKEQLRAHEAIKLNAEAERQAQGVGTGTDHHAAGRQTGALAVLCAINLGFRASEIVSLEARDVGGGEAFIARGKTRNAIRRVLIPEPLRSLLAEHAQAVRARGETLLFPHPRQWVRDHTRRLCKAAAVPMVCAHALRGMHATLATEAGATGQQVAAQLGHHSKTVTERHYIREGASQAARWDAVSRVLRPGAKTQANPPHDTENQPKQVVPVSETVVEGQGSQEET